jgi:hypothetical protein
MITVRNIAAQGDVLLRRVERIPSDAVEQPCDGRVVVAHSETGHHHVIESPGARLFATHDPLIGYLRIDGPFADVVHERPFDTHETIRLLGAEIGPTYFEVRRQREHHREDGHSGAGAFTDFRSSARPADRPLGWRRVRD